MKLRFEKLQPCNIHAGCAWAIPLCATSHMSCATLAKIKQAASHVHAPICSTRAFRLRARNPNYRALCGNHHTSSLTRPCADLQQLSSITTARKDYHLQSTLWQSPNKQPHTSMCQPAALKHYDSTQGLLPTEHFVAIKKPAA